MKVASILGKPIGLALWRVIATSAAFHVVVAVSGPFPEQRVHEVQINLEPGAADSLRRHPRRDVRATMTVDGVRYNDVEVHLKGSTGSFRTLDDKPAFTVDFHRRPASERFCGCDKLHLNNAVEDPSFLNEWWGWALFFEAGIQTPAVSHAQVRLGERRLGLYVLKEGWTRSFQHRIDAGSEAALLEPEDGKDPRVEAAWVRRHDALPEPVAAVLRDVSKALCEADPALGRNRLASRVDVDALRQVLAMEAVLAHRDGYLYAGNNYRLRVDPKRSGLDVLPHGMDQLFQPPDLAWSPQPSGHLARVFLKSQEDLQEQRERCRRLLDEVVDRSDWVWLLRSKRDLLASTLPAVEAESLCRAEADLESRWQSRMLFLRRDLARHPPPLKAFERGPLCLTGWTLGVLPSTAASNSALTASGDPEVLSLSAIGSPLGSWSTAVRLPHGRFRFEGRVRCGSLVALPFGRRHGASLRVSGDRSPSPPCPVDSGWYPLSVDFDVSETEEEVRLFCEFRASSGTASFDTSSLKLTRLE